LLKNSFWFSPAFYSRQFINISFRFFLRIPAATKEARKQISFFLFSHHQTNLIIPDYFHIPNLQCTYFLFASSSKKFLTWENDELKEKAGVITGLSISSGNDWTVG
jgi:hypothetical protein